MSGETVRRVVPAVGKHDLARLIDGKDDNVELPVHESSAITAVGLRPGTQLTNETAQTILAQVGLIASASVWTLADIGMWMVDNARMRHGDNTQEAKQEELRVREKLAEYYPYVSATTWRSYIEVARMVPHHMRFHRFGPSTYAKMLYEDPTTQQAFMEACRMGDGSHLDILREINRRRQDEWKNYFANEMSEFYNGSDEVPALTTHHLEKNKRDDGPLNANDPSGIAVIKEKPDGGIITLNNPQVNGVYLDPIKWSQLRHILSTLIKDPLVISSKKIAWLMGSLDWILSDEELKEVRRSMHGKN